MYRKIGDVRLNVVEFGSGARAFVGVGGWAGSWELWQQPLELLSRSWRAVSYDHRGTGESPVPPEAITADALVRDLFGVLDALGIERCLLGAESAGAKTALAAALERPERFHGLVLVDGSWEQGPPPAENQFAAALRADFAGTLVTFVDACLPGEEHAHVRRWGLNLLRRSDPDAAVRLAELGHEWDLPARVGEMGLPTLLIHSRGDRIVPYAAAERLAAALPRAELVALESESHVPTMTDAARVVAEIERFATGLGI